MASERHVLASFFEGLTGVLAGFFDSDTKRIACCEASGRSAGRSP
jgi:hypothetical protein